VRFIAVGLSGGKTVGSKVIVSPLLAFSKAQRRVPEPLSAALVTVNLPELAEEYYLTKDGLRRRGLLAETELVPYLALMLLEKLHFHML